MISVIARIPLVKGRKDEATESVKKLMKGVAAEEGTLYYTVNIDKKSPDTLVFMERYRDMDALKAHAATPHFQKFMEETVNFAEGPPEIQVLSEIASI